MRNLVWLFLFLLASCGTDEPASTADSAKTAVPKKENFAAGTMQQLTCVADGLNSYALYLPANFDTAKRWPLLVFFDPHGSGKLPVEKYKTLADRFGFVLAGSNAIRNGMEPRNVIAMANAMITDVQQRLPCDPQRLYLGGFSGGARMAGAVAAQRPVRGVIGCSAGFVNPQTTATPKFICVGIAGIGDMNYNEVQRQSEGLRELKGARAAFFPFEGKHEWPPLLPMESALECLSSYAMRDSLVPYDTAFFANVNESVAKKIDSIGKKDVLAAAAYYESMMAALDSVKGVTLSWEKLYALKDRPAYKSAKKAEDALLVEEMQWQTIYGDAMGTQQLSWWEQNLANLDTTAKLPPRERLMRQRVWAYLSLAAYSYASQSIQQGDPIGSAHFLTLYARVDPKNPEWAYLRAKFEMTQNKKEKAMEALEKALALGFRDRARLEAEATFKVLYMEPRFQEILKKVAGA